MYGETVFAAELFFLLFGEKQCYNFASYLCLTFIPPEMSPEQQRALVHKRLSVVADEIFRILEIMMGEYEAEVSHSHEEIEHQRKLLDITLKTETNLHTTGTL